jgi:diguanylate cyclase
VDVDEFLSLESRVEMAEAGPEVRTVAQAILAALDLAVGGAEAGDGGTLSLRPDRPESWEPLLGEINRLLARLAETESQITALTDRAQRAESELEATKRLALLDSLTGLGNRLAWDLVLDVVHARAVRYGEPAVVVIIDLDDLKRLNDSEGHLAGDLALCVLADTLVSVTREPDRVARLGGDEFGVVAQPCTEANAELLVERLHDALEANGVRASIGWAAHDPARHIRETYAMADLGMYTAKGRRKAEG